MIVGMRVNQMITQKMKSLIAKAKNRFFCDHTFEPVYFNEKECIGIHYFVCSKCGKVAFGRSKITGRLK